MSGSHMETSVVDSASAGGVAPFEKAVDAETGTSVDGDSSLQDISMSGSTAPQQDECWICREDGKNEKLIRPCACRGSMGGVHRSCVETWIARQRESSEGCGSAPECPVCHQEYFGEERQPGILAWGLSICRDVARHVARSVVLILVLSGYWAAGQDDWLYSWQRIALLAVTALFWISKLVVLFASLPLSLEPPTGVWHFVVTTRPIDIGGLFGEVLATLCIVTFWIICDTVSLLFLYPYLGLLAVVLGKVVWTYFGRECRGIVASSSTAPCVQGIESPAAIISGLYMLFDPRDVVAHGFVAIAASVMVFSCSSQTPLLVLFAAHSATLLLCILEMLFVGTLSWQTGKRWAPLVQMALFSTYAANLLRLLLPQFVSVPWSWTLLGASSGWMFFILLVSIIVNRGVLAQQFQKWQQRHGRFHLSGRGAQRRHTPGARAVARGAPAAVPRETMVAAAVESAARETRSGTAILEHHVWIAEQIMIQPTIGHSAIDSVSLNVNSTQCPP